MAGVIRVVWKDLFELLEGVRGVALLLLPLLLLLLVGQLREQTPRVRILLGGVGKCDSQARMWGPECNAKRLMEELVIIELKTEREREAAPLQRMLRDDFDLVVNYETEIWRVFTAETDPVRLATLSRLAAALERAFYLILEQQPPRQACGGITGVQCPHGKTCVDDPSDTCDPAKGRADCPGICTPVSAKGEIQQAKNLFKQLVAVDAFSPVTLVAYYDQPANRSVGLLPMTIGLIICFMPFVIAAPSLIREREAHTLEVLLAAPHIGKGSTFVGKSLVPVFVTLFEFLLMLVLVQSIYGLNVKAGISWVILFLIPPILSSTFLGLIVSSTARSQSQVVIAVFLYLLGLNLLSGFFYPIEEGSNWVQPLSKLFPLTFANPSMNAWMYGAPLGLMMMEASRWLVGQTIVYGGLALVAYRQALRKI